MSKDSIYEGLKTEQTSRINFRDTALYLHLASTTTALGLFIEFGNSSVLVLIPLSSAVFAVLYFINDFFVGAISAFISSLGAPHADWEAFHRRGAGYRIQKWMRRGLVLGTFLGGPAGALWVLRTQIGDLASGGMFAAVILLVGIGWMAAKLQPKPAAPAQTLAH